MRAAPLRAAVIGLGVGARHAAIYDSDPRCTLATLCDINEERLREAGTRHPSCRLSLNAADVLGDPDIDVVSIASYDTDHGEQVLAAIAAGKHVFVEKPLCLHDDEFQRIDAALRKHPDVQLSSNLVLRRAPRFLQLKQEIAAGTLGRLFYFEGDYNYGRIEKITEGWRGQIPFYSVVHGGAIHLIDLLLWLSGGRVRDVVSAGSQLATAGSPFKYPDMVTALLRFDDGMTAKVSANFGCVCPHSHGVAVYGTHGSFVHNVQGGTLYRSRDPEMAPDVTREVYEHDTKGDILRAFVTQVLEGTPGIVSAAGVLDAMAVSLAIERSMGTGQWEPVCYARAHVTPGTPVASELE